MMTIRMQEPTPAVLVRSTVAEQGSTIRRVAKTIQSTDGNRRHKAQRPRIAESKQWRMVRDEGAADIRRETLDEVDG